MFFKKVTLTPLAIYNFMIPSLLYQIRRKDPLEYNGLKQTAVSATQKLNISSP